MTILYTKQHCGKCADIKKVLKKNNIDFVEKSVEDADNLAELISAGIDLSEAPVLFKEGKYYTNRTGMMRAISK